MWKGSAIGRAQVPLKAEVEEATKSELEHFRVDLEDSMKRVRICHLVL